MEQWIIAVSSLLTALLTGLLVWMAYRAWRTAKETLETQRGAYEQARKDSIEQTRPYVSAIVVPGLHGHAAWDLYIKNSGRTAARGLTLEFDNWPESMDDIATSVQTLMSTKRTLPPGEHIRALWRFDLRGSDEILEGSENNTAGMSDCGTITVTYSGSDDDYVETYEVMIEEMGLTPTPTVGPEDPKFGNEDLKRLYSIGEEIARRIAELSR